jgi:LacI family transcriptional regulator
MEIMMVKPIGGSKTKRPSMKDVAQLAGVSRTTASYVINNAPDADSIPPETQARVRAAVEELGYRPNALAQGLRSSKSHVLGFIADEIATTPFSGKIIKGAQDAAWEHGKILLMVNTDHHLKIEEAAIDMMLERQVEGIIYAAMFHRLVDPPANIHEVATILVDCYCEDRNLPSVVPDEVAGGHTATEFLLKKGHRRIGIINGKPQFPATVGRLEGYKQALASFDLPFDERLICFGDWWQENGYEHTLKLMRLSEPPTALFCTTDRIAMGAYDALKELGLSIPGDVAVIGFDNQDIIAAHSRPTLTTVALPYYEMGQWAVEYLIKHEDQVGASQPVQKKLVCPLIERESVGGHAAA